MKKHMFQQYKRGFTLIEVLVVIAIIGILFIVLVSRFGNITDKAKVVGVQVDFKAYQTAFESVIREHGSFNALGWDTGDVSDAALWYEKTTPDGQSYTYDNKTKDAGDRIRNSYDVGDANLNGKEDPGETFIGRKFYTETWTGKYTLKNPGDPSDFSGYRRLADTINANLNPSLYIDISSPDEDGFAVVTTNAVDGWGKSYRGYYMTNVQNDGQDGGAIVLYSAGPNGSFGTKQAIAGGQVRAWAPGYNVSGRDDCTMITYCSYSEGSVQCSTVTGGLVNNQGLLLGDHSDVNMTRLPEPKASLSAYTWQELQALARAKLEPVDLSAVYNINLGDTKDNKYVLVDLDGNDYEGFVFIYHSNIHQSMYKDGYKPGHYFVTDVYKTVQGLYAELPLDLQRTIKQVPVTTTHNVENTSSVTTKTCSLFLPSFLELGGGEDGYDFQPLLDEEGYVFDYFSNIENLMTCFGVDGEQISLWCRSATKENDGYFCVFVTNEYDEVYFTDDLSEYEYGLAPCFVIG